ncbi:MAG: pilus assembly protein N-terminal domain-containing protein [Gemmataceae bacterium]|nr:pilus assembly protein N-terminal domain-containing protein [Gemmata sp.]MDW8199177.1 pilus assembly protein N-terminal domain-containing protein [Gemmataceae bacterium]
MSLSSDSKRGALPGGWRTPWSWALGILTLTAGMVTLAQPRESLAQAGRPPGSGPLSPVIEESRTRPSPRVATPGMAEPHMPPVLIPAVPTYPLQAVSAQMPAVPAPPPAYVPLELPPVTVDPGVSPAAFQPAAQPKEPGGKEASPQPLPQPKQFPPFRDDKIRLPRLGSGGLGLTPIPTEEELKEYAKYVKGVIDPRNTLDLVEGRARVVLLNATPTRTQIADPTIASFRLLEPQGQQMTIIGAKAGTTVLNLWFDDPDKKGEEKIISYLVRVIPDPEAKERLEAIYKVLEIEINKAFPNSRVRLTLVGDKLMVSGQAHDIAEATQILRIARANAPGETGAATRPPLTSIGPTGRPQDPLRPDLTPGVGDYLVEGSENVINNLRIPGEQQVMLRVVVAEVNRAAARSIGLNFSIINNQGTTVFAQQTGQLGQGAGIGGAGGVGGQGLGQQLVNLPVNLDNGQIPIAINALRTLNYARSLAEPNLTALNGRTAIFLAGGQFPVPVIGGFGAFGGGAGGFLGGGTGGLQGVQFVPFGVQLAFTPIITDRDRIRLTLNATVSTRDNAQTAIIGGANIPGLNTRTFSTTVELREGQTMAVAGLIQNNIGATGSRVPFFGDLPFLGRLASFQQTSAGEQELIVLVTPELVHPLEPHELSPLPGADIFEPGDMEFYLAGRLESRRSYDYRSAVRTDIHRMLRYRRCEDVFIVGPSGHVESPALDDTFPLGKKDNSWLDVLPASKK